VLYPNRLHIGVEVSRDLRRAQLRRLAAHRLSAPRDVERMDRAAKRRYLEHRLNEIDHIIEHLLDRHMDDPSPVTIWDVTSPDSDLWTDMMDLDYLEASRRAILQTLADLNRPS
jgi:hypothetical protein